jgi:Ca-activated chloride channel family protein
MINYFDYEYDQPQGDDPFSVYSEVGPAPWNDKHLLVHIGLQGKEVSADKLPPANLVFLIDVSGSMNHPNKLPLVKKSFQMLVDQLRPEDHVAIVVYAGAAGAVLEPTPASEKRKIINAIESLQPGGSTAGAAGLRMAYALADEHYNENGNNRVILATDGDFNVGESSNEAMQDLIEEKRKEGVFLTVLGYGMGNLKDSKMEILADQGNGNYAYIDNLNEARKVLVNEFGGTLFTIATDVKLQVEFNPARVKAYRLIGYENRKLNDEDFNNDRKDAGDLGSGHKVTALYEIIPVGVKSDFYTIDDLKYQPSLSPTATKNSKDWLTVKLRYKHPRESKSRLLEHVVNSDSRNTVSNNFTWSSCVAAFGMVLKQSQFVEDMEYKDIIALAQSAKGQDSEGYRSEFISMLKTYEILSKSESSR